MNFSLLNSTEEPRNFHAIKYIQNFIIIINYKLFIFLLFFLCFLFVVFFQKFQNKHVNDLPLFMFRDIKKKI